MHHSNRTSTINNIHDCSGNHAMVDYRGTKQTLARFLEALRFRAALAVTILGDMPLHGASLVTEAFAELVEPKCSTGERQRRMWRGSRLALAVIPVR